MIQDPFPEASYPVGFRKEDAAALGEHLRLRHCVELVGMKRVGISNFLRFFLNHTEVVAKYINQGEKHLFVAVDLNDLVEVEIFPFWILTFKRFVDRVEGSQLPESIKKEVSLLFLDAIQSQDLFLAVEGLRKCVKMICDADILPTFFLLRFDRLGEVVNKPFYANLVGLREATAERLAYVFTSFRTLDRIAPEVFERKLMSEFSHEMYLQPAKRDDVEVIFSGLAKKYALPSGKLKQEIIELCGGHVQYLQLAAIVLSQKKEGFEDVQKLLVADERIRYLGEEIWESLREGERDVLLNVVGGKQYEREKARYLWVTGILDEKNRVFSRLFGDSLGKHGNNSNGNGDDKVDFTKKEHLLYNFLLEHKGEVCEREKIIEAVWSEVEDLGVSDWTIDRLVARLRTKLKKQGSRHQIITVKTRGYRLAE